jgi:NitT/TauT family transport system ATP-binding protein
MGNVNNLISVENVSKTFETPECTINALEDVTFSVREGEFVSLIGQSGCGKTTTLNLIAGFEKPTAGAILFDGKKVENPSPERIVVFQDYALFPWRTVRENVAFGLESLGAQKKETEDAVAKKLELVGLTEFKDAYPYELSGGMKQRTSIARAFATNPRALLMDEPVGALDAITRRKLIKELERILLLEKKTILFVTHSVSDAVHISDRILVMSKKPGKIIADIKVDLKRPRDPLDQKFAETRKQILEHFL